MIFTGRPSRPPLALVSSSQIFMPSRACLPLAASGPVSDMPKPILIGSLFCAWAPETMNIATAARVTATPAAHANGLVLRYCSILSSQLGVIFRHLMRILPKCARGTRPEDGGLNPVNHDGFDFASAAASECSSLVVFRRCETGDALLEGWKFDHDKTMEFVWTFHDLKTSAPSKHLATKLLDNRGHKVGVLLVLDGVVDF